MRTLGRNRDVKVPTDVRRFLVRRLNEISACTCRCDKCLDGVCGVGDCCSTGVSVLSPRGFGSLLFSDRGIVAEAGGRITACFSGNSGIDTDRLTAKYVVSKGVSRDLVSQYAAIRGSTRIMNSVIVTGTGVGRNTDIGCTVLSGYIAIRPNIEVRNAPRGPIIVGGRRRIYTSIVKK